MKNPNGYGSVFKLSGKRRRPYCARVTIGWTEEGKQQYKILGYYEERSEAMIALAQYNDDPYDLDNNKITFEEMYEKWAEEKFPKISQSGIRGYTSSYDKCERLHKMKFKQIRKMHMQRIVNDFDHMSFQVRNKIKTLFLQLYRFAIENDIVEKNYAEFVEVGEATTTLERVPFTKNEIDKLWDNLDKPYVDSILIMIYSGLRPSELLKMQTKNIDIEKRIMIGGLKTQAGKNRAIPIHKKILPLIKDKLDKEYLVNNTRGKSVTYSHYSTHYFKPLMEKLKMNHLPHDCRHTTATLLDNAEINPSIVKKIIGHKSQDITERVYTHKTIEQLVEAIDKI